MSDTLIRASEPYVSEHETSFNSDEASPHTESASLDTHASAYRMADDPNNQQPPPNGAKTSESYHSTAQVVDGAHWDYLLLTHQALHHHGRKSKSSHKDRTVQYLHSQHSPYGSIPSSNDNSTIHHHPYPTFIHESDLEQPGVQVQAQVEPLHLT